VNDLNGFLKQLLTLFVIVDPIGTIPLFLSLTAAHARSERNRIAGRAAVGVVLILLGSAVMGRAVLLLFNISVASFRVGGGIFILLMAIDMVNAQPNRSRGTPEEKEEAEAKEDIAIVPLAIPLLAGPGAISTVILYTEGGWAGLRFPSLLLAILLVGLACWLSMKLAIPIGSRLGTTGIHTLTRLMGLILAAVAIEFITGGIRSLLPGLATGRVLAPQASRLPSGPVP
jgi:multiple antibiotic resistance protein